MQKPPLNRTMKGRASSMRRNMTKEEFHLLYHFLRMFSWEVFFYIIALSGNDRFIGPVPPPGERWCRRHQRGCISTSEARLYGFLNASGIP